MDSGNDPGREDDKEKERGKSSRKRKRPEPPLQANMPQEEGAPVPAESGKGPRRIAEIMTEDPLCCLPETPLPQVAKLMAENSCGAIPVVESAESRRPLGMITDRDVALRTVGRGLNPLEMTAGDVMTASPITIGPDASVEEGAELMSVRQLRRIIVVDARGRVRGLLAQAQLARHLPHGLSGGTVRGISRPTE